MRPVFADTGFFIALLSRRDSRHQMATQHYLEGNFSLIVTTAWVLTELANGMSGTAGRERCRRFVENLRRRKDTRIVECESGLFWRGFDLYGSRADKEWSLTDCISFIVMAEAELTDALTGDHHFEQAGFTALLRK